ncbi:TPA: hypothetical protein NEB62_004538 [Klebsiella quasipneumoniae]|uniref:hypothetical protein n=1 Tax=Klebsiella quasipneumoniae TaxID=1463165 RepID=UPI002565AE53|nr:hypothetical protein [Klebsiella quasipneumoniae]MDL4074400.1 hypothetical protein [Klebsiella quasipneumoniae]HCD8361210.1 hypothetical protein [Klebsiella quasipneumoniae]HCD8562135.1 hypothetical protein [Klebsiella quasipneumoniae]
MSDCQFRHLRHHKRENKEGKILFAGPVDNHADGFILMRGNYKHVIHAFLQEDPFIEHNIADAVLLSFEPILCAQGVPVAWADKAKFI